MPVHSHGCIGTECEVGTQARAPSVIPAWPSTIDCQLQGIKGNAADDISNLDVSSLCLAVPGTEFSVVGGPVVPRQGWGGRSTSCVEVTEGVSRWSGEEGAANSEQSPSGGSVRWTVCRYITHDDACWPERKSTSISNPC